MTTLAAATRALLDEALAMPAPRAPVVEHAPRTAFAGLRVSLTPAHDERQAERIGQVLAAVDWPQQTIPLPGTLTPAQREVAETLAGAVVDVGEDYAIPAQRWVRRRWLGLDPPHALEQPVTVDGVQVPLWAVLTSRDALDNDAPPVCSASESALDAVTAGLDARTRADVEGDILLGAYRINGGTVSHDPEAAGAWLGPWGVAYAERLLALFDDPAQWLERGKEERPPDLASALALGSMARAGMRIDARFEPLVVLLAVDVDTNVAICSAIAPQRRAELVVRAAEPLFANHRVRQLIALLPHAPDAAVVDAILAALDEEEYTKPRPAAWAALRTAASGTPVEAVVAQRLADKVMPPRYVAKDLVAPGHERELSPLQRAQCAVGAKNIMGCGTDWVNDEEIQFLELFGVFDDADRRLYDVAVLMGEDGVVFKAGTDEPVAWLVQYRLSSDDPTLVDALQLCFEGRPRRDG